jgi:hypothetical protein
MCVREIESGARAGRGAAFVRTRERTRACADTSLCACHVCFFLTSVYVCLCVCDGGGNSAMSTTAFLDDNARMLADLQAVQRERYQQGRDALSPIEKTVGMVIPVLRERVREREKESARETHISACRRPPTCLSQCVCLRIGTREHH